MKEHGKFLLAVLVGLWFSLVRRDRPWGRIKGFFILIGSRSSAPADLLAKRNAACEGCPIFYKPLGTCGSPLDKELEGLGCWCHTRTKNRLAGAECWLFENTDGKSGWDKSLYL